jgi:hypothetical protein
VTTVPAEDVTSDERDERDDLQAAEQDVPLPDALPFTTATTSPTSTTTTTTAVVDTTSAATTTTRAGATVIGLEPLPAAERAAPPVQAARTRLDGLTAVVLAVLFLAGLGLSVLAARRPLS